jgi:hypothetical protein
VVALVAPANTNGDQGGDPLLRAISDLRDEVNRLIDDQVARLGALESTAAEAPAAPVRAAMTVDRPGPVAPTPPKSEAPAKRTPRPATAPEAPPQAPSSGTNDDPLQRLDALAKHLDGRLRRGKGDGERPKQGGKG